MCDYSELKRLAEAALPDDASPYLPCPVAFMNAATPAAVLALIAENERYRQYGCDTCDGSGHLHRIDGEYYGACTSCGAYELEQAKRGRDQLKAEVERLQAMTSTTCGVGDGSGKLFVHGDYDSIKRVQALIFENEALRHDAERYHWLRDKSESVHGFYLSVPIWFSNIRFRKEDVDNTIDTAMSQGEQANG